MRGVRGPIMVDMKSLQQLRFDNSYARLPEPFHSRQAPTPFTRAQVTAFNPQAARLLDLDPAEATNPAFVAALTGAATLSGSDPVAMCYSGHQFGHYVPRLGDGRAILLGEVLGEDGLRWDLHLKGAGPTLYSRSGDGRAVLRSTIREYLCSEAMHSLDIPSSRALCVIASDDEVYRERIETGAMLVRMAPSHVRFGSFEYFYYQNRFDDLQLLADYVIDLHFPALRDERDPYAALLSEIIERTARLIARWQAVGFAHGVMNSDNMAILGFTLDYGPFGFLDAYEPGYICNHSDHQGRYAFDQQPGIGLFNLSCLAQAMLPLLDDADPEGAAEQARTLLQDYEPALLREFAQRMGAKLGLRTEQDGDRALIADLLQMLAAQRIDYTLFFRRLCEFEASASAQSTAVADLFQDPAAFEPWAQRYRQRLLREHSDDRARRAAMLRTNPKFVLRNYMAQIAIEHAERGDFSETETLLSLLQTPFDEHPGYEHYAGPPPEWAHEIEVSCSS